MMNQRGFVVSIVVVGWMCVAGAQPQPGLARLGPQIGTVAPEFAGVDQFGRAVSRDSVMGKDGVMLVFFRSADW